MAIGNWHQNIATLTIRTTFRFPDSSTTPGPTFTDPLKLEHWHPTCPQRNKGCGGRRFVPAVVNKVAAMAMAKEERGTSQAECDGYVQRTVPGETEPSQWNCGVLALYDITITYKPVPKVTP